MVTVGSVEAGGELVVTSILSLSQRVVVSVWMRLNFSSEPSTGPGPIIRTWELHICLRQHSPYTIKFYKIQDKITWGWFLFRFIHAFHHKVWHYLKPFIIWHTHRCCVVNWGCGEERFYGWSNERSSSHLVWYSNRMAFCSDWCCERSWKLSRGGKKGWRSYFFRFNWFYGCVKI